MERHDIATRQDCERLVERFYGRALHDPFIGWLFVDVAQLDLEAHLPQIASFWETILLGAKSYGGGAFHPHAQLHRKAELKAGHFDRWLALWRESVDELFEGPVAEQAKDHAHRVAYAFHRRLQGLPPDFLSIRPREDGALPVTRHGPPSVQDPPA
ncbi:group III truncated hemoglobin [Patulibacter brassicae]|uniref:Group III truncated hemoglobin n=1 Tax=Patulibacter brassicae TaxID=1705717 RepID=A0ABU4VG59_9ACTN|nr:group III truncated hemoglobin [Patulibacter brassicae]MDX8150124.1 group III truncated hemoglobin [Patulibacter brassicae]